MLGCKVGEPVDAGRRCGTAGEVSCGYGRRTPPAPAGQIAQVDVQQGGKAPPQVGSHQGVEKLQEELRGHPHPCGPRSHGGASYHGGAAEGARCEIAAVLKSTVAGTSTLHLAPIVIDEIRVQGSRCGPFAPALRALSQGRIDVLPLISARYSLDEGLDAFDHAGKKGTLKVLVQI